MKTTNFNNEAAAPASVRPSESKTGNQPTLPGFEQLVKPFKFPAQPYEYRIQPLRECPTPESLQTCETPEQAAAYWRLHIAHNPYYDPERETFAVLLLNTRKKIKGHQIVSIGTHDTLLVHAIPVFRLAVMASAPAIVLGHCHPSGDATPSEADIKVTRDLIRAGQLLKIEVVDHIVMGNPGHQSLRALGYFY
jgi:DNA repair protein RadC